MIEVRSESDQGPLGTQAVRILAIEAWRRAEAMGLVPLDARLLHSSDLGALVRRLREAGIARDPALRLDNLDVPSEAEAVAVLRLVIAALEASPVPATEWPSVTGVLDVDQLASLIGISVSSLRRYLSGARETPDDVAARLHHVALVVGDLSGAYNGVGVRRWFDRKRTALGGRAPASLLAGEWAPEDPGPQKVRALAQSLVMVSVT